MPPYFPSFHKLLLCWLVARAGVRGALSPMNLSAEATGVWGCCLSVVVVAKLVGDLLVCGAVQGGHSSVLVWSSLLRAVFNRGPDDRSFLHCFPVRSLVFRKSQNQTGVLSGYSSAQCGVCDWSEGCQEHVVRFTFSFICDSIS